MRGQLFTLPQGNYRIQAVKAQCEIRSLEKQLHLAHMRADLEAEESLRPTHSEVIHTLFLQKRCQTVEEVKKLRKEISELKIKISTITKGVPFSQIDVSSKRLSSESLSNVWPSPLLYCLI